MSGPYRVIVRQNMVVEIRPVRVDNGEIADAADDRLDASARLARNNLENGCLDGDYDFTSLTHAHEFAGLCVDYLKNLCERSHVALIEAGTQGSETWRNPFVPKSSDDE